MEQNEKQIKAIKTSVGGQALMEGIMMKGPLKSAMAVRKPDGSIDLEVWDTKRPRGAGRIPFIRGIFNFIDTMLQGYKCLMRSAEISGGEEEPTKFEIWLNKKFGTKASTVFNAVVTVIAAVLCVGLFIALPSFITSLFSVHIKSRFALSAIEGLIKMAIFLAYIIGVSKLSEIHRTFMYHGAEHKTIFCYENGLDLTVENVRKQKRFHPRCGTSFIFVIMILSILAGSVITWDTMWIRVLLKLVSLPLVVGVGYEYITYAGKHENTLTRILSAPGLWLQHITTREPDDSMIEVGIASVKASLVKEFPDYDVPTEEKVAAAKKAKAEKEAEAESSGNDGGNSENN